MKSFRLRQFVDAILMMLSLSS